MKEETLKDIDKEIEKLKRLQVKVQQDIVSAPEGKLDYAEYKKGYTQMYYRNGDSRRYLRLRDGADKDLAGRLAQRDYAEKIDHAIAEELEALTIFKENFRPGEKYKVLNQLTQKRQELIRPYFKSIEQMAEEWYNTPYPVNMEHNENRQYDTEQGDVVRSKSEMNIANYLFYKRKYLYYHYEQPLQLKYPKPTIIHPDFTIISRRTGQIKYLEHGGRIGQEKYGDDFVHRVRLYSKNGITLGKDLLYTFESSGELVNLKDVEYLLKEFVY